MVEEGSQKEKEKRETEYGKKLTQNGEGWGQGRRAEEKKHFYKSRMALVKTSLVFVV